jgi:hypothetical protein
MDSVARRKVGRRVRQINKIKKIMQNKMTLNRRALRVLAGFSLLSLVFSTQAAMSTEELINNTDWLMGGVADLRENGSGTISIVNGGGAVSSGSITKAILYWAGNTHSEANNAVANVTFNGQPVTGSNIGFSSNNQWDGWANSQAYRADVTAQIGGLANGVNNFGFSVPGALKDDFNEFPVNGASLLITYSDGNSSNNRNLILFGGNDSNLASLYDGSGWGANITGALYNGLGKAYLHLGVSDGEQSFDDDLVTLNGNPLVPFTGWNGTSLGGDPTTGLWDLNSWDITSALTPGLNNLNLATGVANVQNDSFLSLGPDYTSLIHGFIDLPADQTAVPEPTTIISGLAFAGLVGARLLRRRR